MRSDCEITERSDSDSMARTMSFSEAGKTSTMRVSTCSALRTSMYSLLSRQCMIDLRILQYHLKTTRTYSSYVAFLPCWFWKETAKPGSLAHSSPKACSLDFQCMSSESDSLRKRPRLAACRSVQQKMCVERSRSSLS